jgi:hypothetical protein
MMNETIKPEIGMGATLCGWSDRHAATIVEVISDKTIVIQQDSFKVIKGSCHDGSAEYEYSRNPEAGKGVYTLRKNGRWVRQGESLKDGYRASVGFRSEYYDPHF